MSKDVRETMFQLAEEGHVFRLFSDEEVDLLSAHFRIYNYPAGEIVSKPGETLKMLGILVSGEVFLEEKTELKGNCVVRHEAGFRSRPPQPVRL